MGEHAFIDKISQGFVLFFYFAWSCSPTVCFTLEFPGEKTLFHSPGKPSECFSDNIVVNQCKKLFLAFQSPSRDVQTERMVLP